MIGSMTHEQGRSGGKDNDNRQEDQGVSKAEGGNGNSSREGFDSHFKGAMMLFLARFECSDMVLLYCICRNIYFVVLYLLNQLDEALC